MEKIKINFHILLFNFSGFYKKQIPSYLKLRPKILKKSDLKAETIRKWGLINDILKKFFL